MLRIAVATSDGETINEHFGRARHFFIYEVEDDGTHRSVATREILPHIHNHETSAHAAVGTTDQLGDVDVVFASQIGPGAADSLQQKGIKSFSLNGTIHKALTAYGKRHKLLDLKIPGVTQRCGSGGGCGPCGGSGSKPCK